jgi:hypothetical protein
MFYQLPTEYAFPFIDNEQGFSFSKLSFLDEEWSRVAIASGAATVVRHSILVVDLCRLLDAGEALRDTPPSI